MSQTDSSAAQAATNMIPLDIMFVIDRSGSMETMGDEVYKGFNTFVATQQQAQKQNQRIVRLTTLAFDDEVEVVHDRMDIAKVPIAKYQTFEPRGMTSLFDAVGKAIHMVHTFHKQGLSQVIIAILTDGEENSSRHTNKRTFNQLVQLKRKEGWEFVFLAANQDAIRVGGQFGFSHTSCLTYGADETSCRNMMGAFSQQVQRSISVPNSQVEFSQMDRDVSIQGPAVTTDMSKTTQHTPDQGNHDSFECSQLPEECSNDLFAALPRISRFAAIPETQVLPDTQQPDNALQ